MSPGSIHKSVELLFEMWKIENVCKTGKKQKQNKRLSICVVSGVNVAQFFDSNIFEVFICYVLMVDRNNRDYCRRSHLS